MRARRRLIGTRCSGRPSSDSVGGATGAAAALAGAAALAARASPLVTRPSRPVPATAAASTPFSARILAAAGEATPAAEVESGHGGGRRGSGGGLGG